MGIMSAYEVCLLWFVQRAGLQISGPASEYEAARDLSAEGLE